MKTYTVYKILSNITNKIYIGITSLALIERLQWHYSNTKSRVKSGSKLSKFQQAIFEQNYSNFEISQIITNLSKTQAILLEKKYIQEYNSLNEGYNSNTGGNGCLHHTDETKLRMSISRKGKPRPLHVREALRMSNINRKISDETRQKISNAQKGRVLSDETKNKLRLHMTGKIMTMSNESRQRISEAAKWERSPEHKQQIKTRVTGNQYRSLIWKITDSSGNDYMIKNLAKFCREHKLQSSKMQHLASNKIKNYRGYKCKRVKIFKGLRTNIQIPDK